MKKMQKRLLVTVLLLVGVVLTVGCTKSFSIDSMWKSSNGTVVSFNEGSVSASLFGFNGGPEGTYSLSEKADSDGKYTLHGSHITGGEVDYLVEVKSNNEILLTSTPDSSATFAPKSLSLKRQ
ncbi:hypothetical protein [Enterococcus sp. AZ192]|uniref:hypothetical protein n=1 Tax=unclassified Enterococcus TaxID=2608891 RepID=UPI003D2A17A9